MIVKHETCDKAPHRCIRGFAGGLGGLLVLCALSPLDLDHDSPGGRSVVPRETVADGQSLCSFRQKVDLIIFPIRSTVRPLLGQATCFSFKMLAHCTRSAAPMS